MQEAQPPTQVSKLRRTCRALWRITKWGVVIVVVLAVIYITWMNIRGKRAAAEMLRELQDRGIPPIAEVALDESENVARYYLAASELFTNYHPLMRQAPVVSSVDWPRFGEGFTPEQATLLQTIVDENRLAFEVLRRVKPEDQARFGLSDIHVSSQDLNLLGSTRRTARWLKLDSFQAASVGDLDRAVGDCLASLNLSRHMASDESAIIALVRISIAAMGQDAIESLLSRSRLSDDQLQELSESLAETRSSLDYPRVLSFELGIVTADLQDLQWQIARREFHAKRLMRNFNEALAEPTGQSLEEELYRMTAWDRFNNAVVVTFSAWCPGHVRLATVNQSQHLLDFYDQLSDPATGTQELVELIREPPEHEDLKSIVAGLRTHLRILTRLDVAQAALDVERFRLREGRWPSDMAEAYNQVPACPYGHKLRLISRGDELRVYSIGPNGVDDLGISEYDDEITTGEEDDVVFILLNPEQRNRPATTIIDGAPAQSASETFKELRDMVADINRPHQNDASTEDE